MDTTDCLGLPYPECDPPLTKDASDIEQFRDLAFATDAAVQSLADIIQDDLVTPPMVMMRNPGYNIAGSDITHFLPNVDWDTQGMSDTVADVIRVQEDGWYMIGGSILTNANQIFLRVEPLVNGDVFSSRQGPSFSTTADSLMWTDAGFFRAGDALNFMTRHVGNPAVAVNYVTRMWALQVLANV